MNRYRYAFVLLMVWSSQACGDESRQVAGHTIDEYGAALADDDRVIRLRAIRSLGVFGAAADEPLRESLGHDDPAVRYIAAVHLGRGVVNTINREPNGRAGS